MIKRTLFSSLVASALLMGSPLVLADSRGSRERINDYLDHKGHRIENRLDHKRDRIEHRMDHRGGRIDRQLDRAAGRAAARGKDRLSARLDHEGDHINTTSCARNLTRCYEHLHDLCRKLAIGDDGSGPFG